MSDAVTTVESLKNDVKKFIEDRDWGQFHNPKNLSMGIVSEAAELLDLFLWCESSSSDEMLEKRREDVEDEIADILYMVFALCIRHDIEVSKVIKNKLIKTALKYPIEKAKGKCVKYTEL